MKRVFALLAVLMVAVLAGWWVLGSRSGTAGAEVPAPGSVPAALEATTAVDGGSRGVEQGAPARSPLRAATRIDTVDPSGAPLTGVTLTALLDQQSRTLGVTGPEGLTAELAPRTTLTAALVGFDNASVEIGPLVPEQIRMVLRARPSLRGIVTRPDGSPAGAGIHVAAFRDGRERTAAWRTARRTSEGVVPQFHAVSGADSCFTIEVPEAQAVWSLTGGGRGAMVLDDVRGVRPGEDPIELVVHPVYAARIELVDETGGRLQVPSHLFLDPGAVGTRCKDAHLRPRPLFCNTPAAAFAGLDGAWFEGEDSWRNVLTLCTVEGSPVSVGPYELTVRMPGYEPATLDYAALPLSDGLHTTRLALKPAVSGWGRLQVDLLTGSEATTEVAAVDPVLPVASIVLRRDGEKPLKLAIRSLHSPTLEYTGVPWGSYRASVQFNHKLGRGALGTAHDTEVVIGPELARLTVDLTGLASLELHVFDASGAPWEGEVQASIGRPQGGFHFVAFHGPPYRIQGLAPGTYAVGLLLPFRWSPPTGSAESVVEVSAGAAAHLRIAGH